MELLVAAVRRGRFFNGDRGSAVLFLVAIRTDVDATDPLLDRERDVFVYRAGVRLLLLDAKLRQQLQYFVGLDFQLASQLINSDFQLHR